MKTHTVFFLLAFLGITSCNKDMKPTYINDEGTQNKEVPTPTNTAPSVVANPVANTPLVPSATTTPVVSNASGANPEHGKPGHRCDIAVGAPLNSPPNPNAKNAAPPQQISVNPSNAKPDPAAYSVPPKQAPQKTAPGMNPPHGQAGHRCDIAVGAPLNSPKAAPAPTPANPNPVIQNSSTPIPDPAAYPNNNAPK